jgi:hypothetical protein
MRRELAARTCAIHSYRHRIPLGLLMLERGWITAQELRRAVEAQRAEGRGRLGQWLLRQGVVDESKLTRALATQWSCPVLSLERNDPERMAPLMPRLFVEALGALPLHVAASRLLYLGYDERPDPVLAVALERMTGFRVEGGAIEGSQFREIHSRALNAAYAPVELLEAASERGLARAFATAIEKAQPVESRLVRLHGFLWLRMWLRRQTGPVPECADVRDLVCTLSARGEIA